MPAECHHSFRLLSLGLTDGPTLVAHARVSPIASYCSQQLLSPSFSPGAAIITRSTCTPVRLPPSCISDKRVAVPVDRFDPSPPAPRATAPPFLAPISAAFGHPARSPRSRRRPRPVDGAPGAHISWWRTPGSLHLVLDASRSFRHSVATFLPTTACFSRHMRSRAKPTCPQVHVALGCSNVDG